MGVLHQAHLQLPTVLFFLPDQEIWSVGLLHQHLPYILLLAQHSVDGGGTPLALARDRLDSVRFQMLLDLPYTASLYIEVKDHSNDFGLLGNNLHPPIRALGVAEQASMIEQRLTAPHTVADAELDVLAAGPALRLVQCGQLVDDSLADPRRYHNGNKPPIRILRDVSGIKLDWFFQTVLLLLAARADFAVSRHPKLLVPNRCNIFTF